MTWPNVVLWIWKSVLWSFWILVVLRLVRIK